jgi:hypothetical protein
MHSDSNVSVKKEFFFSNIVCNILYDHLLQIEKQLKIQR